MGDSLSHLDDLLFDINELSRITKNIAKENNESIKKYNIYIIKKYKNSPKKKLIKKIYIYKYQ